MYNLPIEEFVKITVYNMLGVEVRTLVNKIQRAGLKTIKWYGLDNNNKKLYSCLYIYSLQSKNFSETKKMLLIK